MRYCISIIFCVVCCGLSEIGAATTNTIETAHLIYKVGSDGQNYGFIDKGTGTDYCNYASGSWMTYMQQDGTNHLGSVLVVTNDGFVIQFSGTSISAHLKTNLYADYFEMEVVSISDTNIDHLILFNVPLTLSGATNESFAGCGLSMNLGCHFFTLPQASSAINAYVYPVGGIIGAKVAVIGCSNYLLRSIMKTAVLGSDELPHSTVGGPWALDSTNNFGSGIHNWGNLTTTNAGAWLWLATNMGVTQIDWIDTFMRGDWEPLSGLYPDGKSQVSNVVAALKAGGISSGLHSFSFRIDHDSTFTHPIPDPGLLKDWTNTLSGDVNSATNFIIVDEDPSGVSAKNGYTIQIEDELILYTALRTSAPYGFTNCTRGAHGTTATTHSAGASVYHLAEDSYDTFKPDPRTSLLTNVAAHIASTVNDCGFDMLYFDGMGGDGLLNAADGWYYNAKLAYEVFSRLSRPTIIEMSVMSHGLWVLRSRHGAWDSQFRGHKAYADLHAASNAPNAKLFMPSSLGWSALKMWSGYGLLGEPTFPDDIEYLCAKSLATDSSILWQGAATPDDFTNRAALQRLADITRNWEYVRAAGLVPQSIKTQMSATGSDFALTNLGYTNFSIYPVKHSEHKADCGTNYSESWTMTNPYSSQPLRCRIEVLMSAAPWDASTNKSVLTFLDPSVFTTQSAVTNVYWAITNSSNQMIGTNPSGYFTASNSTAYRTNTWVKTEATLSPYLNLDGYEALGLFVYGDGNGEVLNVQIQSPASVIQALFDNYIVVDFTGWRYYQLIEAESERIPAYSWPYGTPETQYGRNVDYTYIQKVGLWLNNLPAGDDVELYLSPVKGVPMIRAGLTNLSLAIGGDAITFPGVVLAGYYLEFNSTDDCKLYEPFGDAPDTIVPTGTVPDIATGANTVTFSCDPSTGYYPRVAVTITTLDGAAWTWTQTNVVYRLGGSAILRGAYKLQ